MIQLQEKRWTNGSISVLNMLKPGSEIIDMTNLAIRIVYGFEDTTMRLLGIAIFPRDIKSRDERAFIKRVFEANENSVHR